MATRQEKYPNTDSFFFYNANPKGRITGDCSIRARCTALEEDYNKTLMDAVEIQLTTGYSLASKEATDRHMRSLGWVKHSQPRKRNNTKYTGTEFCEWLEDNWDGSPVLCNIGGNHIVCIKKVPHWDWDGCYRYKVVDIWDSTGGCIGNWWSKNP